LDALPVTQARVKKESVKALKTTRLIHKEQRCMKNLNIAVTFISFTVIDYISTAQ